MMSAKMGTVTDEEMIRMAFSALDKDGDGTIKSSAFKHLMTHICRVIVKEFLCGSFSNTLFSVRLQTHVRHKSAIY